MKYLYRVIGVLFVLVLGFGFATTNSEVQAQTTPACHPSYKVQEVNHVYSVVNNVEYVTVLLRCVYDQNLDRGGLSRRQWCIQTQPSWYVLYDFHIQQDGDTACRYDTGTYETPYP